MQRFRSILMLVCLFATVNCYAQTEYPPSAASTPIPNFTTSWLGNSFGGPSWVQHIMSDLYVLPNGTCVAASYWDEAGHEFGEYKGGKVVGAMVGTHGWFKGGTAVTANANYVYIAQQLPRQVLNPPSAWPTVGMQWFGVGRRTLSGAYSTWPGASGPTGPPAFLVVNNVSKTESAPITGLAASATTLYVANPYMGVIDLYNASTMAPLATPSWAVSGAQHMAYEAGSNALWVIEDPSGTNNGTVHRFDGTTGVERPVTLALPSNAQPTSISVSPSGTLVVGDSGPSEQIYEFTNLGAAAPTLSATFGTASGIYAPEAGVPGTGRSVSPLGAGIDSSGDLYVASQEGGCSLSCYSKSNVQLWELHGLEFVECADLQPGSSSFAYTLTHRYNLNFAEPSGLDSMYSGYVLDKYGSPNDPRRVLPNDASVFVRNVKLAKFVYALDMNANNLQIYRFTGNGTLTAPSVLYRPDNSASDSYPPNNPNTANGTKSYGFLWTDTSGTGTFLPTEYQLSSTNQPVTAWSIDDQGGIWSAWENIYARKGVAPAIDVQYMPCTGLDSSGNPIYSLTNAKLTPAPAPFNVYTGPSTLNANSIIERMQYVSATDTMYLSGFTPDHSNSQNDWKTSGPVICRYDKWSTSPSLTWESVVPFVSSVPTNSTHETPDAISVAGNLLFNGYLAKGEIRVYDANTGNYLGSLLPGPEVGSKSGYIDTMYGVRAQQLANGNYVVFAEEDYFGKVIMYHLTNPFPPGS